MRIPHLWQTWGVTAPRYSKKTKKKFHLYSVGTLIRKIASEKQNFHLCNALDYSNLISRVMQRLLCVPVGSLFPPKHCAASWVLHMEQGGGSKKLWYNILRDQKKFIWFYSSETFILSCPRLISENSLKESQQKFKKTKKAQIGQLVQSLLGSHSTWFSDSKITVLKTNLRICNGQKTAIK